MFGIFKRSKIENWEINLLKNLIVKLPEEYIYLLDQINDGLLKGVRLDEGYISGYIAFRCNTDVLNKYDNVKERSFVLSNIKVYDNNCLSYIYYDVYIAAGTIMGYSLRNVKKYNIDVNRIDISELKKEFIGESDYNRIEHIFSEEEKMYLNPSEVYSVVIDNKEYFHIKSFEDGDFIGIDKNKILYKVAQDPFEAVVLQKNIIEICSAS